MISWERHLQADSYFIDHCMSAKIVFLKAADGTHEGSMIQTIGRRFEALHLGCTSFNSYAISMFA